MSQEGEKYSSVVSFTLGSQRVTSFPIFSCFFPFTLNSIYITICFVDATYNYLGLCLLKTHVETLAVLVLNSTKFSTLQNYFLFLFGV